MATQREKTVVYAAGVAQGIALVTFPAAAAFAVLYGICETVNGNWAQLDMTSELGASSTAAAFALTAFWALAGAFVLVSVLPEDEPALGILTFGLVGLGCSALLPLTISFGQDELTTFTAAAAGGVFAFYQLGYGVAAFGVGPLLDTGVELPTVYAFAAVVAAAMGGWSFAVARRRPNPASLHPQLGHGAR